MSVMEHYIFTIWVIMKIKGQRAHGEKLHVCNTDIENCMYKNKMPRNFLISLNLGASHLSTHSYFKASCHLLILNIYLFQTK